jgi:nicotinate-nucleotide adenylyltransferase
MLEAAAGSEPRYSIACTEGGLFVEIARECRASYGAAVALRFLCGADAASRVVNWEYGRPDAIREMLQEFELLVAPRGGAFDPPPALRGRIHPLPLAGDYGAISATEVRRRIAEGQPWEHLVPEPVAPLAREYYRFTTEAQSARS